MDGDREKRWRKREIWRERDMKIWGRREGDRNDQCQRTTKLLEGKYSSK